MVPFLSDSGRILPESIAMHRNDNKNGNVWGDPAPALGKETSYETDATARVKAADAQHSHEQET